MIIIAISKIKSYFADDDYKLFQ